MILAVAFILLALAPLQVQAGKKVCEGKLGKKLLTFSKTAEMVKFPCKYNALRDTTCGKWRITLSPTNQLDPNRNKLYVIRSLWLGVERISDGRKWEGRTDLKIARKYIDGRLKTPFNTKDGTLKIDDIFDFETKTNEVILKEKKGDFKLSFGLYDPLGRWHRDSTFSFECSSSDFVPSAYPVQLCGNGTRSEVKKFKRDNGFGEDYREATLFYNVFIDPDIVQTDSDCASAQRAMAKRCEHNGQDYRYQAANLCWPILGQTKYQRCISGHMDRPISAFRHCVEFVCSGFTDKDSCISLGQQIDYCPSLKDVSNVVKKFCKSDLYTP